MSFKRRKTRARHQNKKKRKEKEGESYLEAVVLQEVGSATGGLEAGATVDNDGETGSLARLLDRSDLDAIGGSRDLSGGGGRVRLRGSGGNRGKCSAGGGSQHYRMRESGGRRLFYSQQQKFGLG